MSGSVALVGAGPGDPGLLTVKAARYIAEAEVLVYDALVSVPILARANEHCERIYVGKRARSHTLPQAEITALLIERAQAGKRVVRLKGGDPFVFGRGSEEAQELAAAGIFFTVVPGISSALAAAAYAGIPVTHRAVSTSLTIATGHEDPTKGASTFDWGRLADGTGTAVLLMAMGNLEQIVDELLAHGRAATTPVAVIQQGTTPQQRSLTATLESVVEAVKREQLLAPAIVVVGDVVHLRSEIAWFDRHVLFGKRILITRPREEAAHLAQRLWEIGAEPILSPTIAFAPPTDPEPALRCLETILQGRSDAEWLCCTSRQGVHRLFAALHERAVDARALGRFAIAALGAGTVDAFARYGIVPDLVASIPSATGLATALGERLGDRPGRLLFWGAQEARPELISMLTAAGHCIEHIAAYQTLAVAAPDLAQRAEEAHLWFFASGSAVRSFVAHCPEVGVLAARRGICALGTSTAAVAAELGLPSAVLTPGASLDATLDFFGQTLREKETLLYSR